MMAKKKELKKSEEQDEVTKNLASISLSLKIRDQVAREFRWKDYIDQSKGKYSIDQITNDPEIEIPPINLVHAFLKEEIPSLYLRDPHFEISPRNGSSIQSAKIREMALNHIWNQKRMKRESKKNIHDAKLVGHSWFKTGFTGKFGTVEDGNGNITEFIESQDFFGYRVSWKDIVINPEAIDPPHDCRWIAHRIVRPLSDVKSNSRYVNTETLEGSSAQPNDGVEMTDDERRFMSDVKWVTLWEVWDKVNDQVYTLAEGHDRYLEPPKKWPYKMRGFPFSFLGFNKVIDEPYPIPDPYYFEPQVLQLIKIRAQQMDHLKRANRQIEIEDGVMDEEQEQNMAQGLTGNLIKVRTLGKIKPLEFNNVPFDAYAIEERVKEDLVRVSGQDPIGGVGFQKTTTRTISELIQRQKGAQNRRS